jgi:hypothetical protein
MLSSDSRSGAAPHDYALVRCERLDDTCLLHAQAHDVPPDN